VDRHIELLRSAFPDTEVAQYESEAKAGLVAGFVARLGVDTPAALLGSYRKSVSNRGALWLNRQPASGSERPDGPGSNTLCPTPVAIWPTPTRRPCGAASMRVRGSGSVTGAPSSWRHCAGCRTSRRRSGQRPCTATPISLPWPRHMPQSWRSGTGCAFPSSSRTRPGRGAIRRPHAPRARCRAGMRRFERCPEPRPIRWLSTIRPN
jgi:hypothetical protein